MGSQDFASVGRRFSQPQAINRQELARRRELHSSQRRLEVSDRDGQTVDFVLTGKRDLATARRFFERAIDQHDMPKSITLDKSGANAAAVVIVHRHPAAPTPTGVVLQAQPHHFAAAAHAVKRGIQAQCVPVTFRL